MWLSGKMCLYPPRGASGGGPTDITSLLSYLLAHPPAYLPALLAAWRGRPGRSHGPA
jgi:hypothetical protein